MRHIDALMALTVITFIPAIAAAEPVALAASNGPWIALAVIGMVRAILYLGHGSSNIGDDRAF